MAELTTTQNNSMVTPGFSSLDGFETLQRMAHLFNESTLVPKQFQGKQNFGNCVIALNMAQRLNADPLMVMQNLYVVYGNPSWSAKFLIAMFNQCGRFSSIHYEEVGKPGTDGWGCRAWAAEIATGERVEGPIITIGLAKKEGWYDKSGSKWQTMPQQMLRYRAAAWFIRTTAPELSMGLPTRDEAIDIGSETLGVEEAQEAMDQEIAAQANKTPLPIDVRKDVPQDIPDTAAAKQPEPERVQGPTF